MQGSTRSSEIAAVVQHSSLKGYQALSLLTPPLYTCFTLYRRGRHAFALNRLLRATWIGGAAGAAAFGAAGWARLRSQSFESIQDRRVRLSYNVGQIRTDDYSKIGSVLLAVLTPALFWNRAHMFNLIFGGAGIGSASGVLVHLCRSAFERSDLMPTAMTDELKRSSDVELQKPE